MSHLARMIHRTLQNLPPGINPEEHPVLGPVVTQVRLHLGGRLPQTEDEWEEALARLLAEIVVAGWDRHGAPSVARHPTEGFVASFEGPGGPYTVEASNKREAYREARREWVYRLLTRS